MSHFEKAKEIFHKIQELRKTKRVHFLNRYICECVVKHDEKLGDAFYLIDADGIEIASFCKDIGSVHFVFHAEMSNLVDIKI